MGPGRLVKGDLRSGDAPPLRIPKSVGTGDDPSGSEVPLRSVKQIKTRLVLMLDFLKICVEVSVSNIEMLKVEKI
jgi:hypothetical protein